MVKYWKGCGSFRKYVPFCGCGDKKWLQNTEIWWQNVDGRACKSAAWNHQGLGNLWQKVFSFRKSFLLVHKVSRLVKMRSSWETKEMNQLAKAIQTLTTNCPRKKQLQSSKWEKFAFFCQQRNLSFNWKSILKNNTTSCYIQAVFWLN